VKVGINIEMETPDFEGEDFFKEIESLIEDIRSYSGDGRDTLFLTYFSMMNRENDDDPRNHVWTNEGYYRK